MISFDIVRLDALFLLPMCPYQSYVKSDRVLFTSKYPFAKAALVFPIAIHRETSICKSYCCFSVAIHYRPTAYNILADPILLKRQFPSYA